jgi:myo-inositol 2-dehydrogenase/D-chiro-inositol 1-dehydrogenase
MFPQLAQHKLELAAVCDLDEAKARTAQVKYGFAKAYTNFRAMLDAEKPQAVFCVGGPKVHYEVGMEVLDRGYPLYVQKSPAPSSQDTRRMAELAAKRNVLCHVGFNFRSAPAVSQARGNMRMPEFGRPLMGIFRYGLCFGNTVRDVVMDQHCHLVDLALFLMGPIARINVMKSPILAARDYVCAVQFQSGSVGTLNFTSGQIVEKEFTYFEITGEGTLQYSHDFNLMWRRPVKGSWWQDPQADHVLGRGWYGSRAAEQTLGYLGDVANFAAAVAGASQDISPVSSTVHTMEVCEEIVRQLEEGA